MNDQSAITAKDGIRLKLGSIDLYSTSCKGGFKNFTELEAGLFLNPWLLVPAGEISEKSEDLLSTAEIVKSELWENEPLYCGRVRRFVESFDRSDGWIGS